MTALLAGKRVLVAEDEYFIAEDLKRALCAAQVIVVGPVANLGEARALAAGSEIDAAILDVNLCGEKSYPLADELIARAIPCMFVTGYDRAGIPQQYRDVPGVTKPFEMRVAIEMLERIVR